MTFVPDFKTAFIHPSPNFSTRKLGLSVQYIVIHYTEMDSATLSLNRLCDPIAEVSCHYLIDENGTVFQLVHENKRAWHAGKSFWKGQTDLNSLSIGIELQNRGHPAGLPPYPTAQIDSLIILLQDLMTRYSLSSDQILGHSDIAFERKRDPGEHFPWEAFIKKLSLWWPNPAKNTPYKRYFFPSPRLLSSLLSKNGYGVSVSHKWTHTLYKAVQASQRRYTPQDVFEKNPPSKFLVSCLRSVLKKQK